MEIFYVHDIPYIHVDWETSKASDTEQEAIAFLTGEMGMMPINSTIVDNKLLCDIPNRLEIGTYGVKVIWVQKSASGKNPEDILETEILSISRIHDLFCVTSSQYAVTYTGSEITFHVRSNPTPYYYSQIGSWKSVPMSFDGVDYNEKKSFVNYSGGSGSGGVSSVNGKSGVVILTAEDLGAYEKPEGGIPKTDLSNDVQIALESESYAFVVDTTKYGITEGSMAKDENGHYSSEQYDAMYNNYLGFNQAFEDARDAGVSKVIVPKGIYCFCPIQTTQGCYQILQIYETDNIVFDFNGSTFKLCFDSTQRSQYHTYNSSVVYDMWASLLCITASTNIVIENLTMIGDRTERSYIESAEKNQQGTRGICFGPFVDNIEIKNCDTSGFMACSISNCGYQVSLTSSFNMNLNRKSAGTFTNYGYYYDYNNWIVTQYTSASNQFYTISELVDCSSIYTSALKDASKRVSELADKKIYALWHNSGYSHSIDCARYVDILTYETTEQVTPSRIIKVEQLSNFQLEGNERYIRVQCHDEVDTPNPVEGEALSTTTHKMYIRYAQSGRKTIRHCFIHDDFLGAVSGTGGTMYIADNVFKKTYTEDPPAYLTEGTNFHFDGEDTNGELYVFERNKFISSGGIGKLLFIYSPKRLVFINNHCDRGISVGRHHEVVIKDNYFGGGIGIGTFIGENGEYDVNGGRTLRRQIEICGNIISGISFDNTYLTDAKIYNNRIEASSPMSIGTLATQYRGSLNPKIEFVNNVIRLKSTSSVAVNPYSGRNNTIIADNVGNLGLPLWENTTYDTGKITPYTNSYFDRPVVYENLHITASGVGFVNIYGDITLRGCVFDSALWYALKIQSDVVITLENCTFNSTFFSIGSNVSVIYALNGTFKFKFVNCIFNTDKLCTKFHSIFNVQIEAKDCVAGVKEDTTSYQAMLSTSSGSSAYNKTLVSPSSGTSAERPNFPPLHYQYFDTTLGYPIYANAIDGTTGNVTWIDGAGNEV